MAKEAIDKPETFDKDGDAPVIELESREVKSVDDQESEGEEGEVASERQTGPVSASIDIPSDAPGSGSLEAGKAESEADDEPNQGPQRSLEELLENLSSTLANMREGRDALSMRRDLVSLHDKLIPEIQASRDAAKQSEAATETATAATTELKVLLGKVDESISGLEGYLLVNLEERLQTLSEGVRTTSGGGRIPRWLKLAVAGNLLLTAFVVCSLLWPEQIQSLFGAVSSFSIENWLTSMEPRQ